MQAIGKEFCSFYIISDRGVVAVAIVAAASFDRHWFQSV
jgi:hypothetical protein